MNNATAVFTSGNKTACVHRLMCASTSCPICACASLSLNFSLYHFFFFKLYLSGWFTLRAIRLDETDSVFQLWLLLWGKRIIEKLVWISAVSLLLITFPFSFLFNFLKKKDMGKNDPLNSKYTDGLLAIPEIFLDWKLYWIKEDSKTFSKEGAREKLHDS